MNYEIFIPAFISFLATIILTPYFVRKFKERGIKGRDVHKKGRPEVAEMGGVPILIGFIAGFVFVFYLFPGDFVALLAMFLTVVFAFLVGYADDKIGMRQKVKAFLPAFAAVPLMAIQAGHHQMFVPFIGFIDFGIIYPLILIPLGITVVSNAFNLLAGYNGLESGLGLISCIFMGIASYMTGNIMVSVFLFTLSGALFAFLYFNKYPAKIFPGDTGVFIMGSAIAAGAIMSNLEIVGIILLIPHIVNGAITTTDILKGKPIEKFAKVDKEGYLRPPSRKYVYNLYYTIANFKNTTEKGIVYDIWTFEIVCGLFALMVLLM